MDIDPIQTSTAVSPPVAATAAAAADQEAQALEADFDTFLSLLTAQLQNQDPLEPVNSTDFVAQLAQFSAVEQQVQTNDALANIAELLGGEDVASLASWLGVDVQTTGPVFFDGEPLQLVTTPAPTATQSNLVVRNASDEIIARQPVQSEDREITWNGLTAAGDKAPLGLYSFTVESSNGVSALPTQQAVGFSKVEEVRIEDGVSKLVLQGGGSISKEDVLAAR